MRRLSYSLAVVHHSATMQIAGGFNLEMLRCSSRRGQSARTRRPATFGAFHAR